MQQNWLREAKAYIKQNHIRRAWQKVVNALVCIVVFCTTYALILPAITMEQTTFCGMEEHSHAETCYVQIDEAEQVLICEESAEEVHVHTDICYVLPDETTAVETHVHVDECYAMNRGDLTCETPDGDGHAHTELCYDSQLTCMIPEGEGHTHSNDCYHSDLTCRMPEGEGHVHGEICYDEAGALICQTPEQEPHTHGAACYTQIQVCSQEEKTAHTHDAQCYTTAAVCDLEETAVHVHDDNCYNWEKSLVCGLDETAVEAEPQLICTIEQEPVHVHTDSCYQTSETQLLTCTLAEGDDHSHNALCFGTWELTCTTEVHTHQLQCFSDPQADVETEAKWEKTLPEKLTGIYVQDLLATAESQLNYAESTDNYIVLEDGMSMRGYTRYGAWYGDPYGKWDSMFASFCLYYAGANELEVMKDFPLESDPAEWVKKLEENGLFLKAEEGMPEPGDLVFFDNEEDEYHEADHAGIVIKVEEGENGTMKLRIYEGDMEDRVQKNQYSLNDPAILGYGLLPEIPDYELTGATETTTATTETTTATEATEAAEEVEIVSNIYTYSDDTVYVEVQLPEDTTVPADAVLKVTPIESTDDGYSTYIAQAEEAVEGFVSNIALYDISFYTADDVYYPVDDTAKVTMGFVESPVDTAANVQVLHFAEEDAVPEVIENVTVEEKEIEMVLEDVQLADAPVAAALEQQPQMSLFSRAMPAAPAETEPEVQTLTEMEPEVQTLTETRTVVEFETPGFSTFAVVEVKTGSYTAIVLTNAEIQAILNGTASLDGRTLVITPGITTYEGGLRYALTNEEVTVYENTSAGYHECEHLNAGVVQYDKNSGTVTTPADDGFLWKFIKVADKNTYYIQSVETGRYLYIGLGNTVRTTEEPNEIVVYYKDKEDQGNNGRVTLQDVESGRYLACYYESTQEGIMAFDAGNNDGWGEMFLAEYIGVKKDENTTTTDWPLDGRQFVISWLSNQVDEENKPQAAVMTYDDHYHENHGELLNGVKALAAVQSTATVDADGNLRYVDLSKTEFETKPIWIFERVEGKPKTYYIKTSDGRSLQLAQRMTEKSESALTLVGSDQPPQEITVSDVANNKVRLSVSFVEGETTSTSFVNLYGGWLNEGFGCYTDGTALSLIEYIDQASVLGTGGQFVISIPISGTNTVSVLTGEEGVDNYQGTNNYRVLAAAVRTVDADGNVNIEGIDTSAVWEFIPVEDQTNMYYIQSVATDEYLHLDGEGHSLTTEATPQAIEVEFIGDRIALRTPNTNVETVAYDYVHWQQFNNQINRGFAVWGDLKNGETYLTLTKYTPTQDPAPVPGEPVTNLAGKVGILCAVNDGNSVVTDEQKTQIEGRDALKAIAANEDAANEDNGITIDKENNTVTFDDNNENADYSRMIWKFIGTNSPGYYYIQSQSAVEGAGGKYLHLDATGATLSDDPQAIEVVLGGDTKGWENVVCLRVTDANADGTTTTHYLNLWANNPGNGATTYALADFKNNGNHFILAQLSEEEMAAIEAVTEAIDALPNQEALVEAVRQLLDKAIENDDEAQKLQNDTVTAAAAAIAALDELSDEQKLFVGVDRINKLEELDEWLVSEDATGAPIARLPGIVQAVPATGVTVKVFNYDGRVKNETFYTSGFGFFNNSASEDGGGNAGQYTGALDGDNSDVTFELNDAGYPVLVDGGTTLDLSHLFDSTYQQGTMSDGGGLFLKDNNGYYYYYSDMNSAYFNGSEFVLYDTVVRPPYIWWSSGEEKTPTYIVDRRSNFLPFNALVNEDGTSNIVYDNENHQEENIAQQHDLSLGEQTQPTTAIINETTDLWFGMSMEFDFFMPESGKMNGEEMIFDFHGDDDVWVFIDGVLVLDLGGTHEAWDGYINFATGEVQGKRLGNTTLRELFEKAGVADDYKWDGDTFADYSAHDLKFFYMERGGAISYCGIKFNLPTLPPNSLMVNKVASSDDDAGKDFQFRVVRADTKEVFFTQGREYTIMENGVEVGTGTVGADGIFMLKPGQGAVFAEILKGLSANQDPPKLIVQEVLPSGLTYEVAYQLSEGAYTKVDKDGGNTDNFIYSSSEIDPTHDHEIVTFYNTPAGSGTLSITKELDLDEGETVDADEIFYVRVKLADTLIPVRTKYHIGTQTLTVREAGIIPLKAGQTATIIGITPGLTYEVAEFLTNDQYYKPTYSVEESDGDVTQTRGSASVTGIIQTDEEVAITITNDPYDKHFALPITKSILPAGVSDNFYFLVDQVESEDLLTPVKEYRPGVLVRVNTNGSSDANIMIGTEGTGPWYFKVYEENTTSNYFYDPTYYVVKVELQNNEAVITNVLKNGTDQISIGQGLPFVNRRFTELTVAKTVVGGTGTFNFAVNVTVGEDGEGIMYLNDSVDLTNNGSKTYKIPCGANVTVTETNNDGYYTSYEVYSRYEAEDGVLSNGTSVNSEHQNVSGTGVGNIGAYSGAGAVTISTNMPSEGSYLMRLRYNTFLNRSFGITANDGQMIAVPCTSNGDWDKAWSYADATVSLKEDANTIKISGTTDYAPNLDYVDIILTEERAGTIATQNGVTDSVTIHFTNTAGYELPETGGMGTTLFYVFGGILVLAAFVLLVDKKRMSTEV